MSTMGSVWQTLTWADTPQADTPQRDDHWNGQYTSYWNAFLFQDLLTCDKMGDFSLLLIFM